MPVYPKHGEGTTVGYLTPTIDTGIYSGARMMEYAREAIAADRAQAVALAPTSLRQGEAWISCAEKMPPLRVTVLACAAGIDRSANICFWTGGRDWQCYDGRSTDRADNRLPEPTHWMRIADLPAPPIATEAERT